MKEVLIPILLIGAIGPPGNPSSAKDELSALPTLSIELFKMEYVAGEPIIVGLKLANESSESMPRVFSSNEDFMDNADFRFPICDDDGARVCEPHRRGMGLHRIVFRQLKAGEFWQCEQMFVPQIYVPQGMNGNLIVERLAAGRYKLSAKVWWQPPEQQGVHITSNAVDFEIKDPTGVDAQAISLMQTSGAGGFIMGTMGGKPEAVTELLEKYPGSTYARYARVRLILHEGKRIWNTSRGAEDGAKLERVVSDGLAYARHNKDDPLSDNVLLYCARLTRVLDRERESVDILKELVERFPESDAAEGAIKHLEQWDRPLKPGEEADPKAGVERPTGVAGDVSEGPRMGRYAVVAVGIVLAIAVAAILLKRQVKKASE